MSKLNVICPLSAIRLLTSLLTAFTSSSEGDVKVILPFLVPMLFAAGLWLTRDQVGYTEECALARGLGEFADDGAGLFRERLGAFHRALNASALLDHLQYR